MYLLSVTPTKRVVDFKNMIVLGAHTIPFGILLCIYPC